MTLLRRELCEYQGSRRADSGLRRTVHNGLLGSSLKKEADETLFLELALRGYDLSRLRDNETTAEIIKVG